MILPAIAAGLVCAAVALRDMLSGADNPFALMRSTIAALWAAGWMVYGLNIAHFPPPSTTALLYLLLASAVNVLMIPSPASWRRPEVGRGFERGLERWYFALLIVVASAVVCWDVWNVIVKLSGGDLAQAFMLHRVDRTNRSGAYAIPGIEVAHAIAAATGALGYALWARNRSRVGALAACLGLVTMITSTGRWDVVAYGLWCLAIDVAFRQPAAHKGAVLAQLRLFVLLAIFFALHGRLLGKTEFLEQFARGASAGAVASLNAPEALGYKPGAPGARAPGGRRNANQGRPRATPNGVPIPVPLDAFPPGVVAGPAAEPDADEPEPWSSPLGCERWESAADTARRAFARLSGVETMFIVYFGGPFAAFDRALCEDRPAVRAVLFYWPRKIATAVGLRRPTATYAVDPFIDIGVPYNNFTVMYPFWSELGPIGAVLGWILTAALLRLFMAAAVGRAGTFGVAGVVAAIAPLTMGIRALWGNTFFDGSLVIYVGVAAGYWVAARLGRRGLEVEPPALASTQ